MHGQGSCLEGSSAVWSNILFQGVFEGLLAIGRAGPHSGHSQAAEQIRMW